MSTAKKFELAPDEVYIQDALKSGKAKLVEKLSMKALGTPDVNFQARVKHLDMGHVHRLDEILKRDGKLSPIVVFMSIVGAVVRYIVADGFHRHEVYQRKGSPTIRAYVIECSAEEIEHEARMFAAMCNQVTLLDRKPEDIRKAVEMLCADPACEQWSAQKIGDHCGVCHGTAGRWRDAYRARKGIEAPSHVITTDGTKRPAKTVQTTGIPAIRKIKGRSGFIAKVEGQKVYGKTEAETAAKIETLKADATAKRLSLKVNRLLVYLIRRGVFAERVYLHFGIHSRLTGIQTASVLIVSVTNPDPDAIRMAIGDLCLLSHHTGQVDPRRIVACYVEDFPAAMLDLARKDGIEFMTPDQLVESLKGSKADGQ
jgi:uncharacterized ParB-like nuclease family protein